jgi:Domain of unknown function (DUF4936)
VIATPVHYYCYYRIDPAQAHAARAAVAFMFRALEDRLGILGRLFQGEREPLLWMEVYEPLRNEKRFEAALAELCASQRFHTFLAPGSERRIERFVAMAE